MPESDVKLRKCINLVCLKYCLLALTCMDWNFRLKLQQSGDANHGVPENAILAIATKQEPNDNANEYEFREDEEGQSTTIDGNAFS